MPKMSGVREEVRRRFPRLTMSLVMAIIFWIISAVVPPTVSTVTIPGISMDAGFLIWIVTILITSIFLIRALSDALVLGDIVTDIIIKRMGIKGERSPRRAARDVTYIIVIILIATALLPIIGALVEEESIKHWVSLVTVYGALGVIIILIYDIGRILYKIIEQRAESLADRLSRIAEQSDENSEGG
jgi:cation transport ATPase